VLQCPVNRITTRPPVPLLSRVEQKANFDVAATRCKQRASALPFSVNPQLHANKAACTLFTKTWGGIPLVPILEPAPSGASRVVAFIGVPTSFHPVLRGRECLGGGDGLGDSRSGTAHADEPEEHQQKREDGEEDEGAGLLHERGEEMRTRQENRCCGDE
jgi:hypothetical protein